MNIVYFKILWISIRNYKYRFLNERFSWFKDKFLGLKIGFCDFVLLMYLFIDFCIFYIYVYKMEKFNVLLKL